jgi:hypothetical protein
MTKFTAFALSGDRLGDALPLVRMSIPGMTETRWLAHCHQMIRLGGGALAAAASDDVLHGIASWRPDDDLRLGRVLRVEIIVALELSAANPVGTALCDALEALCAEHEAIGVALSLPVRGDDRPSPFAESWKRAGFRRQGLFVCRPVRPARRGPGACLRLVGSPPLPD